MKRKTRSIRNVVLALFAVSTIVAFALFAAYDAIVSSYYRGESSPLTRLLRPAPSAGRGMRTLSQVLRRLNAALLQSPEELTKRAFLDSLSSDIAPFGIALRLGNRMAYISPGIDLSERERLPSFGAPAEDQPFPDTDQNVRVLFQLDFLAGMQYGSIFVLSAPRYDARQPPPYSRQIMLFGALLLLAADGAAGVYFILRLTGPLRRVESAALAMSSGDLETPVAGDQILELGRVFDALETMRSETRELLKRERDREVERRELIANLSHDLRTPLSAIRGYVDGLREGIADTPEKRSRYLGVLGQKIQDLDRMISQIFLLSTLEAKAAPPELRRVDLRAFFRDSIEELRLAHDPAEALFSAAGIEAEEVPLFVRADPLQLRRVAENLVDNSLRHAGRRPVSISVSVSLDDSPPGDAPRRAIVRIEDDGRGIEPEALEKIFDRFYRDDPSRTGGGFGLGLAIARQIVEAHGGNIRAERGGSGGAAFVITLPLEEAES